MKNYSNIISLTHGGRGVYCLDTSMGCTSGMSNETGGCYNDCYAAKFAKLYGYDFTNTVLRFFKSERHKREIVSQINKIKLDFVRIGCSGDPSENWDHTFDILKVVSRCNKEIVIITRHWNVLTDGQLAQLSKWNICINTSVSALDKPGLVNHSLEQYNRIKPFCKSILRIISCDFNKENGEGKILSNIQDRLFQNDNILDTVFRPNKNNPLVVNGVINVRQSVFNGSKTLMSKYKRKTYTGKCSTCKEMCGVNIKTDFKYPNKRGIVKQLELI